MACLPSQTIRELQGRLVESTSLVAVLLDQPGGKVLGLITLHDLLRAQAAMAAKAGTD
jgi:CIC family chloride channel protein